jgi:hypothetical protein
VAFAAFDLLAGIAARRSAPFGSLHRPAVDDAGLEGLASRPRCSRGAMTGMGLLFSQQVPCDQA